MQPAMLGATGAPALRREKELERANTKVARINASSPPKPRAFIEAVTHVLGEAKGEGHDGQRRIRAP